MYFLAGIRQRSFTQQLDMNSPPWQNNLVLNTKEIFNSSKPLCCTRLTSPWISLKLRMKYYNWISCTVIDITSQPKLYFYNDLFSLLCAYFLKTQWWGPLYLDSTQIESLFHVNILNVSRKLKPLQLSKLHCYTYPGPMLQITLIICRKITNSLKQWKLILYILTVHV